MWLTAEGETGAALESQPRGPSGALKEREQEDAKKSEEKGHSHTISKWADYRPGGFQGFGYIYPTQQNQDQALKMEMN